MPPVKGLELRAVGFDERSAKRGGIRTNWVRVRALIFAASAGRRRLLLRHGPLSDRQRPGRRPIRSQQHHRRRSGRCIPGRGPSNFRWRTVVASLLLALILTVLPYLGLSASDGLMIIGRSRPSRHLALPGRRPERADQAELTDGPEGSWSVADQQKPRCCPPSIRPVMTSEWFHRTGR